MKTELDQQNINYFERMQEELKKGKAKEAESLCLEILRQNPRHVETLNTLGALFLKRKKYDTALKCLSKSLSIQPSQEIVKYNLSLAFKGRGQTQRAIILLKDVIENQPDFMDAYFQLALCYYESKQEKAAIQELETLLGYSSEFKDLYFLLGTIHSGLGNFSKSQQYFEKALEDSPRDVKTLINYGVTLYETGDYHRAIELLQEALDLKPNDVEAFQYLEMAMKHIKSSSEVLAITELAMQLTHDPSHDYAEATKEFMLKNYDKAEEIIVRLLNENPANSHYHNLQGMIHVKKQEYTKAEKSFINCCESTIPNSIHLINRANLERMLGRLPEAIKGYRKSLDIQPHNPLSNYLYNSTQFIEYLKNTPKPKSNTVKKALVFSSYTSSNFSDRLSYHFISSLFPNNVEVEVAPLFPLPFKNLQEYDLVVLGMGESLSRKPLMQPQFLEYIKTAPTLLGILSLKYSENHNKEALKELVKHMKTCFVRTKKDSLIFGKKPKNMTVLGDWSISQFPNTKWTLEEELKLSLHELENCGALDRIVQQVQNYRKVSTPNPQILLCSLLASEHVSYEEQHYFDGKKSGEFEALLEDIFEKNYPEGKYFKVDKQKVLLYKEETLKRVERMKKKIRELFK
jgi:tetratricopeptide (TPR) repeat protein